MAKQRFIASSISSIYFSAFSIVAAAGLAPSAIATGIEEVIVTAQKREQNLLETPIAISVLSAAAIEQRDVHAISVLNGMVPNLRLASSPGNANGATINIRGSVTINPALTMEPTVGLYLDGVYIGKNVGGVFDIADLERIEVLRGPQGTLYGKNTLGGAINLITKKPSGEFGGEIKSSIGNYGYSSLRATLDTPAVGTVGEGIGKLSAKLALITTHRDGFVDNENSSLPGALPAAGEDFGNLHSHGGRVALHWQPTDAVDALYSYDFSRSEQRPRFYQLTRNVVPGLESLTASDRLEHGSENAAREDNADVDGHGLALSWDAGALGALGDVTFKSLTGHRQVRANDSLDWDGSPYSLAASTRDVAYRSTSQEFQMLGKGERLNYVVGLYYFEERGHTDGSVLLNVYGLPPSTTYLALDNQALALFTQADYTPAILNDRLTLTAGVRWTREDKEAARSYQGIVMLPEDSADKRYHNVAPTLIANYRLTEDVNVYGKVARGWKAGVFNAASTIPSEVDNPIDPEMVTSWELGMKSRWFDNRLNASVAYFYDDHKDMQISRFIPAQGTSTFTNAGKATVQGIELEVVAQPTDALQLSLAYGWLDPEYKKYEDICGLTTTGANPCGAGVAPGQVFDAKDVNKFAYTPENTANIGVQYTQALPLGELMARLDWSYTDEYVIFPDPLNYEHTAIDDYQVFDARLTWANIAVDRSELSLSAWVKNLTDEEYRINGLEWGAFTTMNFGDPRTYGVDVSLKF